MRVVETRKIDSLGRITLLPDLRRELGIETNDELNICVSDGKIILKKLQDFCVICKNTDDLKSVDGKSICADCTEKIKEI